MTTTVARDARGVSHVVAYEPLVEASLHPTELTTLCGVKGRWKHLTLWWSPLMMTMLPGEVDCMACLVAEARR